MQGTILRNEIASMHLFAKPIVAQSATLHLSETTISVFDEHLFLNALVWWE